MRQGPDQADTVAELRREIPRPGASPGKVILGKYVLERPLGEGGMGTVWLARNLVLDTHVALKLVRPGLQDQNAASRLLAEARAAARIQHPAIVRVFDFGTTECEEPFIVMEVLDGETVDDVLEQHHRIDPVLAVQILLPITEGLSLVHAHGILHRDLKPANIFLDRKSRRPQPKVVDFGIATSSGAVERTPGAAPCSAAPHTVVGSPAYMAPEQACGLPDADARADVWALCVVLFEMLTGEVPFEGETYDAVLREVVDRDVGPILRAHVPDLGLRRILERGLAKQPEQRWQSMEALGAEFSAWLLSRGVTEDIAGGKVSAQERELAEDAPDPVEIPLVPAGTGGWRSTIAISLGIVAGSFAFAATYAIRHADGREAAGHAGTSAVSSVSAVPIRRRENVEPLARASDVMASLSVGAKAPSNPEAAEDATAVAAAASTVAESPAVKVVPRAAPPRARRAPKGIGAFTRDPTVVPVWPQDHADADNDLKDPFR